MRRGFLVVLLAVTLAGVLPADAQQTTGFDSAAAGVRILWLSDTLGPRAALDGLMAAGWLPQSSGVADQQNAETAALAAELLSSGEGQVVWEVLPASEWRFDVSFASGFETDEGFDLDGESSSFELFDGPGVSPLAGAGVLVCAVPGGRFINDWGFPRSGGRTHEGTDVFAPVGTPVLTVWPARIVRIDPVDTFQGGPEGDLGGISVSYVSEVGVRVYNAHLSSIAEHLEVGMIVPAGTRIGYVGRSGNAVNTPPHLHIGMYAGGAPFNPFAVLSGACGDEPPEMFDVAAPVQP